MKIGERHPQHLNRSLCFSLKKKQRWTKQLSQCVFFHCLSWIVVGLIPFHPKWILFSCIIKKWAPPTLHEGSTLEHFRAHANMRIYCNEKETQHNRKQWVSTPSEHHNVTFFQDHKNPWSHPGVHRLPRVAYSITHWNLFKRDSYFFCLFVVAAVVPLILWEWIVIKEIKPIALPTKANFTETKSNS